MSGPGESSPSQGTGKPSVPPAWELSKTVLSGLTEIQDMGISDLTSIHSPLSRNQGGEVRVEWGRGWRMRKGVEVPALCLGLVPLATSPLLRCFPKASTLTKENTNSKDFRSSMEEMG